MSRKPKVTFEQKLSAVKDYLEGTNLRMDTCKRYKIRSRKQLSDRRVKRKPENELTEIDRLKAQNRITSCQLV